MKFIGEVEKCNSAFHASLSDMLVDLLRWNSKFENKLSMSGK